MDGITNSMDMGLGKLREFGMLWFMGVTELDTTEKLN